MSFAQPRYGSLPEVLTYLNYNMLITIVNKESPQVRLLYN